MLTLAIIGRPNVGKSTLFNRLTGLKRALVDDTPGVTRDWREGEGNLGPLKFRLLDTAGLEEAAVDSLAARMTAQTMTALKLADVALMLIDGRVGLTPQDRHFAQMIRKSGLPVVLVVNKAEGKAAEAAMLEAHALGLGDPIAISAEHGEGLGELYEALAKFGVESGVADDENEDDSAPDPKDSPLTMAIIGRPNAGKSTLVNSLLGEERVLTGPEAGITRDAISSAFDWQGQAIKLVDTAGMRKKANVQGKLEKLSVGDTLRTIRFAQVVVLVMDATQAFEKQDLQIAEMIEQEGRSMVLAVNKWDLVPENKRMAYLQAVDERMAETLPQLRGIPVVTLAAERGQGVEKLMRAVFAMYEAWNTRIPTGELNRWLAEALIDHAPPLIKGRRLKIRYMTQTSTRPPSFTLFSNLSEIPGHYLRYLSGSMRDAFKLQGAPIRLKIKKNKNPYEEKDE